MNNPKLQKDIENFENAYKQVSLSVSEKENLKANIFDRITPVAQPSPFFAWSFYLRAVPVALIMFAVIGAPISFAAEKSLPGDVLYKVKTNVNEEVKAVFVPQEERNEYYQSLLTKRLSEIKILAQEGEIKEEALIDFEEALEENVSDVILALEVSEDSKEDILEDHQVVVAALDISEDVLGLSEEKDEVEIEYETSTYSAIIDSEKEKKDESEDKEKDDDKKETEEKLRSLKIVAIDALSKHIEEEIEPVNEDSSDDVEYEEKKENVEILTSELIDTPVTIDNDIKMRLEQEVQILVDESVEVEFDL